MSSRSSTDESLPLISPEAKSSERPFPKRGLFEFSSAFHELDSNTSRGVRVIFILAFLTNVLYISAKPIQLLYLQYNEFATASDISFFVWVQIIDSGVPFFGHSLLGALSARIGVRRTLCILSFCAMTGLLLIAQVSSSRSRVVYMGGYTIFCVGQSIRVVRTIFITENVPPAQRTSIIAMHDIAGPLGAILGPALWILCENYAADIPVFGLFRLNRYTLTYTTGIIIAVAIGTISWLGLKEIMSGANDEDGGVKINSSSNNNHEVGPDVVPVELNDGRVILVNTARYSRGVFIFFFVLMFTVSISMGLIFVGFQPLLVDYFHVSGQQLGVIYLTIFCVAFIPQFVLVYLSRIMSDRHIILLGLALKIIGITAFLPIIGGKLRRWQAIMGFILVNKASRFFYAASMSLASKLLGPMASGTHIGMLSSAGQIGPAVSQLFFAKLSVNYFGTNFYGLIGIPVVFAIALTTYPTYWKSLDPSREYVKVLFREYENNKEDKSNYLESNYQ